MPFIGVNRREKKEGHPDQHNGKPQQPWQQQQQQQRQQQRQQPRQQQSRPKPTQHRQNRNDARGAPTVSRQQQRNNPNSAQQHQQPQPQVRRHPHERRPADPNAAPPSHSNTNYKSATSGFSQTEAFTSPSQEAKIINCSDYVLLPSQIALLKRGLKFTPIPLSSNTIELSADLRSLNRRMRFNEFFHGKQYEINSTLKKPSNFTPPIQRDEHLNMLHCRRNSLLNKI